jgi:hypothetical protein
MKTKIIIGLTIIFTFISCGEDFLDKHPYDLKVVGNFYQTPEDALQALVAVYNSLADGESVGSASNFDHFILLSEIASDNCFGGAGTSDDVRLMVWDKFQYYGFYNPHDGTWLRYYRAIYKANILLDNFDQIDWGGDENLAKRIESECRFLRAYFYFDLVRLFGNIPLLTEVLDVENLEVPQADPDDVYKVIAGDLKFAADNFPVVTYQNIPSDELGRATKWAAEALLARVFLYYTGYYNKTEIELSEGTLTKADVRSYIDDVIENSGHALVDTFEYLWQYSFDKFVGEDNEETVFAVKYTYKGYGDQELFYGSRWQVMIGLRNQVIIPYGTGWGGATVNPKLWDAYDSLDTRRDATILNWDYLGKVYNAVDQREYTGCTWRKYMPLTDTLGNLLVENYNGDFQIDNYFDYLVIRFSDVLLMGAELHLDDNIALAQSYFDMVRDRAYLPDNGDVSHRLSANKDNIMEERRREFALEGLRYWDLLRYDGIAGNFTYAKSKIDSPQEPYMWDQIVFRPETQGLFQIPQTQIDLSQGFLVQNPGW